MGHRYTYTATSYSEEIKRWQDPEWRRRRSILVQVSDCKLQVHVGGRRVARVANQWKRCAFCAIHCGSLIPDWPVSLSTVVMMYLWGSGSQLPFTEMTEEEQAEHDQAQAARRKEQGQRLMAIMQKRREEKAQQMRSTLETLQSIRQSKTDDPDYFQVAPKSYMSVSAQVLGNSGLRRALDTEQRGSF